jgi:squalene-hopene/tetraprenyl-beta-curcumene cyclase
MMGRVMVVEKLKAVLALGIIIGCFQHVGFAQDQSTNLPSVNLSSGQPSSGQISSGQGSGPPPTPLPTSQLVHSPTRSDVVRRAVAHLARTQAEDGSWSARLGPGITALVATSILRNGRSVGDPMVARALEYLQEQIRADGGIYAKGSRYRNYETCLAILCFSSANQDGRYHKILQRAEGFVKQIQWDGSEDHDETSVSYGGAGYGKHARPDLSNTTFLIEALKSLGRGPDDPAIQKALAFVSRCQNLETEHNQTKYAALNPDGGFYYTIAAGGSSQAGNTATGGLRSYGSMTYAGLKSMIYAGVGPEDPRVQAAYRWIKKHYTLVENPGMGDAGLYYYLHTLAKSLDAVGQETLIDAHGTPRQWRQELLSALATSQQPDGSWANTNARWFEGDPQLATGYALLALSYCR